MEIRKYYIFNGTKPKIGPLGLSELVNMNIEMDTLIWFDGLDDWCEAGELKEIRLAHSVAELGNRKTVDGGIKRKSKVSSFRRFPFINLDGLDYNGIYHPNYPLEDIDIEHQQRMAYHRLRVGINPFFGILIHYLSFGIMSIVLCGLKHSDLPHIKYDDFKAGQAIGFLFIPFYNLYWVFVFWQRLAQRINLQFELRDKKVGVSSGLALTVCIFSVIPYLGWLVNYLLFQPILAFQIYRSCNQLAKEPDMIFEEYV